MKLFIYENFKLTLNEAEILLIKEFKDIWESDKSKNKEKAFKYFSYLYLLLDLQSPFADFSDKDKEDSALKSSELTSKDLENDLLKLAKVEYEKIINSNRIIRYIKSTWKLLDSLSEYCETVNFTTIIERGANAGRLVNSVKEGRDTVKQMEELIIKAQNLRKIFKEEMKSEGDIRGDQEDGYFNN